jgi:hypothetical protein
MLSIAIIAAGLADPMPAAGVPTDDDMKALRFNGLYRCRPSNTLINMFSKNSYFDRGVLLMLIALEALLFYTFYYREIAWYPPQYFDQTAFLTESYRLQERIHQDGFGTLWMAMTRQGAPKWLAPSHRRSTLRPIFRWRAPSATVD